MSFGILQAALAHLADEGRSPRAPGPTSRGPVQVRRRRQPPGDEAPQGHQAHDDQGRRLQPPPEDQGQSITNVDAYSRRHRDQGVITNVDAYNRRRAAEKAQVLPIPLAEAGPVLDRSPRECCSATSTSPWLGGARPCWPTWTGSRPGRRERAGPGAHGRAHRGAGVGPDLGPAVRERAPDRAARRHRRAGAKVLLVDGEPEMSGGECRPAWPRPWWRRSPSSAWSSCCWTPTRASFEYHTPWHLGRSGTALLREGRRPRPTPCWAANGAGQRRLADNGYCAGPTRTGPGTGGPPTYLLPAGTKGEAVACYLERRGWGRSTRRRSGSTADLAGPWRGRCSWSPTPGCRRRSRRWPGDRSCGTPTKRRRRRLGGGGHRLSPGLRTGGGWRLAAAFSFKPSRRSPRSERGPGSAGRPGPAARISSSGQRQPAEGARTGACRLAGPARVSGSWARRAGLPDPIGA